MRGLVFGVVGVLSFWATAWAAPSSATSDATQAELAAHAAERGVEVGTFATGEVDPRTVDTSKGGWHRPHLRLVSPKLGKLAGNPSGALVIHKFTREQLAASAFIRVNKDRVIPTAPKGAPQ